MAIPTNLATLGIATASSTYDDNPQFGPSVAINGNRAGDVNDIWHSNTDATDLDWWQVDLQADFYLDRVQILPRQLNQGSVGNFTLEVFSSADPVHPVFSQVYLPSTATDRDFDDAFYTVFPAAWGTTDVRNIQGRTIRITRNDATPNFMTFAEVEVYGQTTPLPQNLAVGRPVTSTPPLPFQGTDASWGNDGNIDGNWWHYSTFHSDDTQTPLTGHFWQVELDGLSKIDYVNVFARSDDPVHNSDVRISILAADGTTVVESIDTSLFGIDFGGVRYDLTVDFPDNPVGKFVKIETLDEHLLNFSELEVLGTGLATVQPGDFDGDGDVDGVDLAQWQSNFPKGSGAVLGQGDADGDGDVDGADFIVWQTHFTPSQSASQMPVPEPQSFYLLILGASLAVTGRWQAHQG